MDSPDARISSLKRGDVGGADELVRDRRHRVLPQLRLRRHQRAQVARARPHVAMRQLEPRPGERIRELVRVLEEAARDLLVDWVHPQGEVGGEHGRRVPLRWIVGVRDRALALAVLRPPLVRTSRTLGQLPLVAEQMREEAVAPLRGRRRPGDLEPAADGVAPNACAVAAFPAQALRLERSRLGVGTDVGRGAGAVSLAKRVPAGNERHRLFVVHRHAAERLANIARGRQRIGVAVGPFRIHVDEAHLHGGKGIRELAVAAIARVGEPDVLGPPVDLFGLPDVLAAAAEAERLEPHRLQCAVAGEDHQVGP